MADTQAQILYITLGCAKNEVDTDRMRSLLKAAGYGEVDTAEAADAVLIGSLTAEQLLHFSDSRVLDFVLRPRASTGDSGEDGGFCTD